MDVAKIRKAKMALAQAQEALDACLDEGGEESPSVDASPEGDDDGVSAKSLKMKMAKYREV